MSLDLTLGRIRAGGMEHHLKSLQRGLEKESLRVMPDGMLAQTPHPAALGSALSHRSITTDYSEALLEFVTPIHTSVDSLLAELTDIHQFTYHNLGEERLWVNSMPCVVESDARIPIARYGSSNVAKMKEAYRRGLGHRYGRLMQTIAGIHFNFSMPDAFWDDYLEFDTPAQRSAGKSAAYFQLTRNFLRHAWLVCYLFGASPAVCKSFLRGRNHDLPEHDPNSFYAPFATSLRLSGLGYSNDAQSSIKVDYNSLLDYTRTLRAAIQRPHPPYEQIQMVVDGKYQQLNPNILQIENEFYGVIRPKQVAKSGESPSRALIDRGVEYVEIRSLDLNPFVPIGIDAECIHFFDLFMLLCLFGDSTDISETERAQAAINRNKVVMEGRDPALTLQIGDRVVPFREAAGSLIDQVTEIAALMDDIYGHSLYSDSVVAQREKINDSSLTASAQILKLMETRHDGFYSFAMHKASEHARFFREQSLDSATRALYEKEASDSIARQRDVEEADTLSFPAFLEDYFRRQNA